MVTAIYFGEMMKNLTKLVEVMRVLGGVHPRIEGQTIRALLVVGSMKTATLNDLRVEMNMTATAASRTAYLLSEQLSAGQPGLGLITIETDPKDRRSRILKLSKKGKQIVEKIDAMLN